MQENTKEAAIEMRKFIDLMENMLTSRGALLGAIALELAKQLETFKEGASRESYIAAAIISQELRIIGSKAISHQEIIDLIKNDQASTLLIFAETIEEARVIHANLSILMQKIKP